MLFSLFLLHLWILQVSAACSLSMVVSSPIVGWMTVANCVNFDNGTTEEIILASDVTLMISSPTITITRVSNCVFV